MSPQVDAPKRTIPFQFQMGFRAWRFDGRAVAGSIVVVHRRPMPSADQPDPDPLAALRHRYVTHLETVRQDLDGAMRKRSPSARGAALAAAAHSVAGTSGSLGFEDVSHAAFALEAAAQQHEQGLATVEQLRIALAAMLVAIDAVVLNAAG